MPRLTTTLAVVAALFASGFAVAVLKPEPAVLDAAQVRDIASEMIAQDKAGTPAQATLGDADVRGIVSQMIAEAKADVPPPEQSATQLDSSTLGPVIEDYLLSNPGILDQVQSKLAEVKAVAARNAEKATLAQYQAAIYDDPGNVVLGNPKGDVTLVEMFDYNCTYCRGALPDLATLMAEDPDLKVILKEFPILTQGSVDAARVAVLVSEDPKINYWDFHQQLFSTRGEVTADSALQVAEGLGGNRVELMLDMNGAAPAGVIQKTYDLAKALKVSGTPTYIIGDRMIPGAVPIETLRASIANMRACGSTDCSGEAMPEDSMGPANMMPAG